MKLADIPTKFPVPFAANAAPGYIRPIPKPAQAGGAASLDEGFPQITFVQVESGGIPPFGKDFNGILNQSTAWDRWLSAGGTLKYDAAFSTAIGGYPQGAVVQSATTLGLFWLSVIDDNTNDPDSAGTGWVPVFSRVKTRLITSSGAFTINIYDQFIGFNRTSGVAVSNAPLPTTAGVGQQFSIQDLVGNFFAFPVTISAAGGQSIAGASSYVMNEDKMSAIFTYYGSNLWGAHIS